MFRTALFVITIVGTGLLQAKDCESVGLKVRKAVEEDPAQVLLIVEDHIVTHEICACEIIGGAISGVAEDNQLVEEIVFTGVSAAQEWVPRLWSVHLLQLPRRRKM